MAENPMMSEPMMWFVVLAFLFSMFVFGGALMYFLRHAFVSSEAEKIDTPEEALEKKVFADDMH
ncbi:hypothetical protein [Macrococcus equipercicus]|uniref:Uncharacterized protein n=1 Tax=Macrococcus equipercicus TaxID=69967 RepID=A0A9Q9BUU8_9STAP|nr:hypothetical protein [Macrococcus equipercicus]UTH14934.1 hypothetical protein KFV11_09160 [Macrococcus equipercicus]